jgi:hypothetical protein
VISRNWPRRGVHSGVGADDDFDENLPANRNQMEPDMDCPVCGANAEQLPTTIDAMSIACPTCGEYDISTSVRIEDWQRLEPQERRDVLDEAKRSAQPGARAMITADLVAA